MNHKHFSKDLKISTPIGYIEAKLHTFVQIFNLTVMYSCSIYRMFLARQKSKTSPIQI